MNIWKPRVSVGGLLLLLAAGSTAMGQTAPAPALTIEDAVALAMTGNRRIQSSGLDVRRAAEGTSTAKTQRLPQFSLYLLGGETLRSIDFAIPRVLGVYPSTGPIPGQTSTITTPRSFTSVVLAQTTQPVSQLWKIHLGLIDSMISEQLAQESLTFSW